MIKHIDEILLPALDTDSTPKPRYNIRDARGNIVTQNATLELANPVAREGTPINKAVLDEFLAASGVTAGTATAYTLAQEEYSLFDGAPIRFRLHAASGDGATLNVAGTGAKPLVDAMGKAMPGGIPAGTWLTAIYSAAAGAYVLAGGESVRALYGERYTVDDAVAHVKDVPGDALPYAEVGEVGGMTYRVNVGTEADPVYELRSAPVTEVESVGRNLLPYPYAQSSTTNNGITYTVNDDGSVVANGTAVTGKNAVIYLARNITFPAGTYIFVYNDLPYASGSLVVLKNGVWLTDVDRSYVITIESGDVITIYLQLNGGVSATNLLIKPRINKGTTALPYTPYQRHTLPIPEAVQALDGYGWGVNADCYNYIDWEKKQFVKRVERVDMGTTNPVYNKDLYLFALTLPEPAKPRTVNALSKVYTVTGNTDLSQIYNLTFNIGSNGASIYIKDLAYADATAFKAALSGVMLYYELAEPIITDISDILPADNILPVEAGGTITAVNEYGYAVPSTITYQRNVLDNRASTYAVKKLRLALELLASIDDVDAAIAAAIAPLAPSPAVTSAIAAAVAPLAKSDLSNASGTFKGVVKANATAVAFLGEPQVRNVTISATDLTAGSSALATGDSYRVYS